MSQRLSASVSPLSARRGARLAGLGIAVVALAALDACGGGGGSSGGPTSTVSSASVAASRYGSIAIVTMSGTNLDSSGLTVTSSGCKGMTRLTVAPTLSTATNAYYSCTVSGAFSSTVTIASNGTTIANPAFTVPAPQVTMAVTNEGSGVNGTIVLTLAGDKAPITVDNFLAYVNAGFYAGTIFHRVVPGFVAQGGGYTATVNGSLPASPKPTNPGVPLETTGGSNVQWSIAMANTGAANSTTSQFFINLVDNSGSLDGGYSVFGTVTSGIPVVQSIASAPAVCTADPLAGTTDCLPQPDVTITSATQTQ